MFQNQGNVNNGGVLGPGGANPMDRTQQHQQNINYNGMHNQLPDQQTQQNHDIKNIKGSKMKPYVKIIEQPAGKALRFRYECEGRSAGSIPGVNSTPENKTFPTIQIVGYKGRAVVVVSCVTNDFPHKPHPHNLVGKEGCKKGVCTLEINSETMRAVFSNLGIQCVKKKDIESALKAREDICVDPFKTGFAHRNPSEASKLDLNSVRLCFQVFIEGAQKKKFNQPLDPVVSDPIYDKKAMSDLVICRLCTCSASVLGNTQIILLCEKVIKEDIAVRFFEEDETGKQTWEAYGDFQPTDVHKQTAIAFKTPRYHNLDITKSANVFIQLQRPTDGATSEKLPFEYKPLDSGRHMFCNLRRNLKRKPDEDIFQQILSNDQQYKTTETAVQENQPTITETAMAVTSNNVLGPDEAVALVPVIDLVTPSKEEIPVECSFEGQQEKLDQAEDIDMIINEMVKELEGGDFQVQQQANDIPPLEENQNFAGNFEAHELSPADKVTNWMNLSEMQDINEPDNSELQNISLSPTKTEDLINQLDEIYIEHMARRDNYNNVLLTEMNGMENCVLDQTKEADGNQVTMDVDDNFDDAATYSSLQIAFKNPVQIPIEENIQPAIDNENKNSLESQHYDHVEINIQQNNPQNQLPHLELQEEAPPRPAPPKFNSPHMHVTAAEEEKLPPLPPKRIRKQDSNAENRSIEANSCDTLERKSKQPAPIIIMKTPDQSPPTKRLPPKPGSSNSNTLPKQKKPGFFSKLFSRRKSKSDLSQAGEQQSLASSKANSKATSPNASREPSIGNFQINDAHRASIKSLKSLQPTTTQQTSPEKIFPKVKGAKQGKPVGRSVSSVSGKRPTFLNADVVHIPLKGDSANSLPHNEAYSNSSTITLGNTLDRKTVSALQLADIPISDGNMELVAIADRQSLRNLCEGQFNVQLDPNVDLTEAEHFALYTSIPPQATASEFDETSAYYAPVDAGEILTPDEVAKRLAAANHLI